SDQQAPPVDAPQQAGYGYIILRNMFLSSAGADRWMLAPLSHSGTAAIRAAAVGILAHWQYLHTSTSEFEYGQGHSEVVQPNQRVRIYPTDRRGRERCFRSHLSRCKSWLKHPQ